MQRHVYLKNLAHIPTPDHNDYGPELMRDARAALERDNLRYDNATGVVYDKLGWLSRFSNPADHEPFASEHDVMRWVFRAHIANAASRKARGYSFT